MAAAAAAVAATMFQRMTTTPTTRSVTVRYLLVPTVCLMVLVTWSRSLTTLHHQTKSHDYEVGWDAPFQAHGIREQKSTSVNLGSSSSPLATTTTTTTRDDIESTTTTPHNSATSPFPEVYTATAHHPIDSWTKEHSTNLSTTYETFPTADSERNLSSIFPIEVISQPFNFSQVGATLDKVWPPKVGPILTGHVLTQPVQVRILLFLNKRRIKFRKDPETQFMSDEVLNICKDGLEKSPLFADPIQVTIPPVHTEETTLQETENTIWMVDMRRMIPQDSYTIPQQLLALAQNTMAWQDQHYANNNSSRPFLKIVLMEWRDLRFHTCSAALRKLKDLVGASNLRLVQQQWVLHRKWDTRQKFIHPGMLFSGIRDDYCFGRPRLQMPYVVRSDYADAVVQRYQDFLPPRSETTVLTPSDTIRPLDVAHFWLAHNPKEKYAKLRDSVTDVLVTINGTQLPIQNRSVTAWGDTVASQGTVGRTSIQQGYLDALLTTKIVVVAQRDTYEDHYRLFEALIGGALVMHDPMWTLPEGYVNGTNIIIYSSLQDLRQQLFYYLEHEEERLTIAQKGWELAMTYHRTHHWMERIFVGKILELLPDSQHVKN